MAQATEANSVRTKIEDALASLRGGTAPDEDAEVRGHRNWYSDENLMDAIAKVQFGGGGGEHLRPVAPSSNHREVSWTMWAVEPIDDEARGLPVP